jgi:fructokinase
VESKAFPVPDLKDAAGSGDWCTAGLLAKIAEKGYKGFAASSDERISVAMQYGQALASWNCRYEGPRGGMYAISKSQFRTQIEQILTRASNILPSSGHITADVAQSAEFCRVCEPSDAKNRRKSGHSSRRAR